MANTSDEEEPAPVWDFYHSFFFSYTVVSTIGYGNLAPTTSFGRILMIFYGLIGIPINGILFANLGAYFSDTFTKLYQKYKTKNPSSGANIDYQIRRFGLFGQITLYLFPGILFFIFMPAILFVIFEGWDYALAVYYAFVTLTTIGFGDYVAGITDKGYGAYFVLYKIFLIFWITFGLGYLVMVVGFLTQGLKSKRVKKLEHLVAQNLKQTQSKIWNNVTKDISYLRRILNETYMMRFKPVYNDEIPAPMIHRSSSCPSLSFEREETPTVKRRRANSEALPKYEPEMKKVQSETDLMAINKDKTFGISALVTHGDLLAKVVDALGVLQNENAIMEEGGVHGFSDEEILASERAGSGWSIGEERIYAVPPRRPRGRAASEVKYPKVSQMDRFYDNNEWTWTSPSTGNKIKEMLASRRLAKMSAPNVSTTFKSEAEAPSSNQGKSLISRLNPFKCQAPKPPESYSQSKSSVDEGMSPAEYLRKTARGRVSMVPALERRYASRSSESRHSNASLPNNDVLEQTTIADLIRALTVLHSGATEPPRRKNGTSSFTPPNMQPLGPSQDRRRFSVHPVLTPLAEQRQPGSSASSLPPAAARRRFSMHPQAANVSSFTPTLAPLMSSGVSQPRRGSLLLPPPYTPTTDAPGPMPGRRRLFSVGTRQATMSATGTPIMRARRPLFPPRILEGQSIATRRTRHESLNDITDIKIDDLNRDSS